MSYYINDESAILVTVSNDLNVTIPASLAAPAQYIDISLSQIKDITIENVKCMSQSGAILVKSLEVLTVWTLSAINKTFYVNAAHHAAASIEIAFTSPMDATAVMNEITRLRSHTNEEVQIYQSQTIDVSQHLLADDGRLENPYKHAIPADGMIDVASQADVIPNYDFSTPVEPLPLQSINSTLQFDVTKSFMQWPRKTSQDNRHSAPTGNLVSTANDPIEIHQVCVPSLSLRNSQQQLEDMLEPGIESSIGWHQGAKLIETAPELRETVENTETERIALLEERTSVKQTPPKKQLDDEDNLYDATPKAENGNQIQNQQSGSVQHNGIDTQESVKGTSIPIKNGETNNTHGHVKISQQMRKNFEGPVLGSFLAAKAVVVEPADCRPVGKSKELSSENSSSPDRHQNESPPRSRHSKIKFGKKYPKLRIDIGNDDKNEIGSLHSEYIEKIQSSTSGTAKLKATGKADVNLSPKPRLRKTPKRSDRRKKNPPKPCTAVSSKQPTKKDINVRNSNMDDTNWEEVFLVDEDPRENPKQPVKRKPKKSSKRGRNIDDNAYSVKKGLPKAAGKAKKKNKSATLPGVQSANTRAAAMTANTKIQDLANTSNNHGDAQPNLLTAQSRPTKIRKQQNELSPIDSAGSNTETPPRMLNDSSSQMLQTKIGEVTTKRGSNFMRPKLPMLPPSIKEHHKARNFKELDGNQVCTSQISNRGDPPEVGQNPIPKNFQEERNQLDAQIDSPPNVTNRRRKNTIENSQSTEGSEFLSMRGPIPEIRPAPPPAPEQELLSERPLNFDNPDNLDEVQFDFFADATLFPIENGAIHEELTTRNAPRTPEPDFRAQGSKIPCTPQETSHNYDAESSIASKKTEAPIPTKLEVPVATKPEALATKLESALASVGSLHNHKFAPEAPMKRKPAAQPRKMQETPTTPHFKSEDKNQAPNEGTHGIIPSNHRPEAGPNARPKPIKTLSKISASEEHMISAKANPYYSIISDGHINQENQALTSKEIHVLLEPESSLEGSSLGGGYENENEPSKDKAMNSDEHCDPAIIIQHKLNSDRMARLLFDSEATHQNCKRGSDQTQQDPRKKIKSIEENKPCRRLPRQVINHEKTPGKTSPDINRKSNLISFGSNGPRNQGTITGIKERSHKLLPGQRLRFYEAEGNSGLKKKIEIVDRNCFGSSNKTLIQERAQTFISVPRTLDVGLRVAQRHSSSMAKEISHKPSSQSARVDMNGSPMPFVHSRHFNLRAQGAHSPFKTPGSSSTAESMIDGGEDFGIFDVKFSESPLLILPTQSPRVSMNFELNSSGTTKKGPSSPNEPRMLGELAPHSIHADGKLVNLQTATIVMPVKPPDPFLGVKKNQECGNSFMDLLRKSTNVSDKRGDNIKERPPHIATKMVDPDRTLVNNHSDSGKASRDKNPAGSSISSSSSSSSSSPSFRSQSQLGHLPNSIEESLGKSPWQKALQPHQRDTLDILCEVSHVCTHFPDCNHITEIMTPLPAACSKPD